MVHGKKKIHTNQLLLLLLFYYYLSKKKKTDLYEMYLLQMICLNMLGDHINMLW